MSEYNYENELDEAIKACDETLDNLDLAYDSMNSAKNWGLFDMLGGGMFSTLVKRNKMSDGKYYMEKAKKSLRKLKDELDDIDEIVDLDFYDDDFLSFADFFFDGFFADFMVQEKINDAKRKIDDTTKIVEDIREKLVAEKERL